MTEFTPGDVARLLATPPPNPGPFAAQPRDWRIVQAGASVAGFVMCEQARPCRYALVMCEQQPIRVCMTHNPDLALRDDEACAGPLPRAELVTWFASHLPRADDIWDEVHARALARLAEEDANPTSITPDSFR